MGFLEIVGRAKGFLRAQGRISLRALQLEFDLDEAALEALVQELVDVQQLAAREGKALSWIRTLPGDGSPARPGTPAAATHASGPGAGAQPPDAELRQLTVLFCDLVDSTRLVSAMDPEDWSDVLGGYQEAVARIVERLDGHVAQYLGDGLLVYFGYPRAHEDAAERAIRAGLDLLDTLQQFNARLQARHALEIGVRIGVHTGPVVVGEVGKGDARRNLALGAATYVAARLQTLAERNTLVVSEDTLRLVRGIFRTERLEPRELKGVERPLAVHRVLEASGVPSALDAAASSLTPFVGRQREQALLIDLWERASAGDGQSVLITGDAGLGKSRLAYALRQGIGEHPHSWLECRGSPYAKATAFGAVIDLVRQGLGFRDEDSPEDRLSELEAAAEDIGLGDADAVPLLAELLSVELAPRYRPLQWSPARRRERTLEALVAWSLSLSERQPVALLIEDLQWLDPSSLELVGMLIERCAGQRMLVMLTARPPFSPAWSTAPHCTALALEQLPPEEAARIVAALSPERELPAPARAAILERADGIPLYVEELTKAALESPILVARDGAWELNGDAGELGVPATLRDSLMARLDRLSSAKQVAQIASALGREFSYRLLFEVGGLDEAALREGLERLVRAELLFQRGAPPEARYTFKHALVQDTAHASMLRAPRRALHARIARFLARRRPVADPALVAQHFREAGLAEEASRFYGQAGEAALLRSAHVEAQANLERGLALLGRLPESAQRDQAELELCIDLGAALQASRGYADPAARASYERARALCREVGDPVQVASSLAGLGSFYMSVGELDDALELGEQLREISESSGVSTQRVASRVSLGLPRYYQGHFADSVAYLDQALAAYEVETHRPSEWFLSTDQAVTAGGFASFGLWALGRVDAAAERADAALAHAEALDHPFSLGFASVAAGAVRLFRREWERAVALSDAGLEIALRYGFPLWEGASYLIGARARAAGEGQDTVEMANRGAAVGAGTGNTGGASLWLWCVAGVHAAVGKPREALAIAEGALELASRTAQPFWDAELLRMKGDLRLAMDDGTAAEAERDLRAALAVARAQEARSLELRAATSLARLWQRQGRQRKAADLLQPVYDGFDEGLGTLDLKDAGALLAELA